MSYEDLPWQDRWRTKELQDVRTQAEGLLQVDPALVAQQALSKILPATLHVESPMHMLPSVTKDIGLITWATNHVGTRGGAAWMTTLLSHPTTHVPLLHARRGALRGLRSAPRLQHVRHELALLAKHETDIHWALTRPPLQDAWPMPMLFPTWPVMRQLNHVPWLTSTYHAFRIYLAPWMNLIYPIITLLGPWYYLRRTLGWKIPLISYLKMLRIALREMCKPSGDKQKDLTKYGTMLIYVVIYLYGIFQSIDMSVMIHRFRTKLLDRAEAVREFVKRAELLLSTVPHTVWGPFLPAGDPASPTLPVRISSGIRGVYELWTQPSIHERIRHLLARVYALDVAVTAATWHTTPGWCAVSWASEGAGPLRMDAMGHPCLPQGQVRNPVLLAKNLVVTGPNAAGKTTYVKTVCANVWMAHVFGLACARRARMAPIHALGTFMRVEDALGSESLFEAEVRRCSEMVRVADHVRARGERGLFFLDEPMHSTPPTEGAATATAVVRYIGTCSPGIRVLVTTHYHEMTRMVQTDGSHFANVSLHAIPMKKQEAAGQASFYFPFQVRPGPSFQCIALELMQDHGLPAPVLEDAVKLRDNLCRALGSRSAS